MNATPSMKRGKNGTRDSVIKAAIERAMREALQLIVAWNRSGGASSLEEARELTYRKAQAALALAKGGQ